MRVLDTEIPDVKVIEPVVHEDNRGYFFEAYNSKAFSEQIGVMPNFCQLNESGSVRGTIRGLHMQKAPFLQAKLVRILAGEVIDVAVDCRLNSPHFGKIVNVLLNASNRRQVWIPRGFAHGFQVLSDFCVLSYQVDSPYEPGSQQTINALDATLNIDWKDSDCIIMSEQDKQAPSFRELYG